MFGHRSDGYLIKYSDPIIGVVPHIMPERSDSQVMLTYEVDYARLARYVVEKEGEGHKIRFMDIVIAAYVRTVAELPELNRFIVNKNTYARKTLSVSFAVLRSNGPSPSDVDENTTKCYFDPHDTIFDVSRRVSEVIDEARKEDAENATMKVAKALLRPAVLRPAVAFFKWLDKHGAMPKAIIDASPFHTSLFMTNNTSIGVPAVHHHLYNFGSTTMFWAMGAIRRINEIGPDGKTVRKRTLPIGITVDERVAPGRVFGMLLYNMLKYLSNPSLLEQPPEEVKPDQGHIARLPGHLR